MLITLLSAQASATSAVSFDCHVHLPANNIDAPGAMPLQCSLLLQSAVALVTQSSCMLQADW